MKTFTTAAMILGTLAIVGTAGAREMRTPDVASLENARDTVAWEAQKTKGSPRQERLLEEQRIQGLIDNLQHGGKVDPAEIDRALERAR